MKFIYISAVLILFSFSARSENTQVSIDRQAVRLVIKENLSIFKKCYEDEYKNDSSLEGKVVLGWNIDASGVATKSQIKMTKLNNKNVEDCLVEKIKTLSFPKAPAVTIAEIQYPFLFQGKKK